MPRSKSPRSKAPRPKPPITGVSAGLPPADEVARFIQEAGETDLNVIARHFGLKGADRRELRFMLRDMQEAGLLAKRGRKGLARAGALPPVGVVDVVERDLDGEFYVRLTKGEDDVPKVRLHPGKAENGIGGAPGLGDRLLVRFENDANGDLEARVIKRLGQSAHRVLGVVRKHRREIRVEPVDRRSKDSLIVFDTGDLKDGDLVLTQVAGSDRAYGPKRGKVLEVVGREDQPKAASLIALHTHGIPSGFPEAAEQEAEGAKPPTLSGRTDLRDLPLITIDPQDARDHDDAVYAHPDDSPKNAGGWVVWVAIADVAAYVRPGSALDRTAWDKGNSVYFPDRVEPMLPERLSAGLCSLREGEDRACMAVRMVFSRAGHKVGHEFVRGLMRSAAKLSYEQAQAAIEGHPDDATGPLLEPVLKPLWAAYRNMKQGRDDRSPVAIETTERKIELSKDGEVVSIKPRISLEAHRLIEEMMIQANVCAAQTLELKKTPLIYRIHDTPSQEKMFALADFLGTIGAPWDKGQPPSTERFNKLLMDTAAGPHAAIVNEVVLRTQMQAQYNPENIGHFGLNLERYAHFTSPIRRYADLVVHRALIRALKLGDDGLTDRDVSRLAETAEHITATERRAMAAERDATDRYVAAYLAEHVGAEFEGRITGVTRFGLFIRLDDTGADGIVPVSTLGDDFFVHDERTHALVGERSGDRWNLGARVAVRLREATPLTGGLVFEMLSEPSPPDPNMPVPRLGIRRRNEFRIGGTRSGPQKRGGPPKGVKRGKRR